jgi:hypothetical protein
MTANQSSITANQSSGPDVAASQRIATGGTQEAASRGDTRSVGTTKPRQAANGRCSRSQGHASPRTDKWQLGTTTAKRATVTCRRFL